MDDKNAKEKVSNLNSTVADMLADSKASLSGLLLIRVSRPVTPIESSLEEHAQNSTDTTNTESPPSESDTLVPLVTSTSEALADVRSDSQEEVAKTPEDAGQVEPHEKLHDCEEQICKEKEEITAAVTEVELGLTGWDEDETLVEELVAKNFVKDGFENCRWNL